MDDGENLRAVLVTICNARSTPTARSKAPTVISRASSLTPCCCALPATSTICRHGGASSTRSSGAATHRRGSFERVYDLPERVLPRAVIDAPTPGEADAQRKLIARAARALGVATADDLRDYYRIPAASASVAIKELVEEGTLVPIRVRGWRQAAYLHNDARAGRRIESK